MRNPLRQHFPAFHNDKEAYLDFAATSPLAKSVIEAIAAELQLPRGNPWRGAHAWSEGSTVRLEAARKSVADFAGVGVDRLVFTKNTTEGLNTAAFGIGSLLGPGDEVLLSIFDHHSVLMPWQQSAQRFGFKLIFAGMTKDGQLDVSDFENKLTKKTKAIVVTHVSNVLGTVLPLSHLIDQAQKVGALVVVDAAQSVGRLPLHVDQMRIDALAFAAHKMYGPTGIGALALSQRLLDRLPPLTFGGGATEGGEPAPGIQKFAAGTPALEAAVGFAQAVSFIATHANERHDQVVRALMHESLQEIQGVQIHGPSYKAPGLPIVSFSVAGIHPHDVAAHLSDNGVYARSGFHCAAPLAACLHPQGTVRVSGGIPTDATDIKRLTETLRQLA